MASLRRLVIDDVRSPSFDAVVCRSAYEALELIRTQQWDEVWLDHDMDFVTGPDVSWTTNRLEEDAETLGRIHPVGKFILHSANSIGRRKMRAALEPHYEVIEMEEYPDKTLRLFGGQVVEMRTNGEHLPVKWASNDAWLAWQTFSKDPVDANSGSGV